jgi:L-threonylcarbamoyladenylate synthase
MCAQANRGAILSNCSADAIALAAEKLRAGGLVAFPTETVYGLGADATNPEAVARIYRVKGRPHDHPVIVHLSDLSQLDQWASDIPEYAIILARNFWPGPMTLILPRKNNVGDFITGGQESVGIRIPNNPIALELTKRAGVGIAAPSANRFGAISPTTALAVHEEIGTSLDDERDAILDGGPSDVGVESTIIECLGSAPKILRPGAITKEMIEEATGLSVDEGASQVRASGTLEQHYAPRAKVFLLDAESPVVACIVGVGFLALEKFPTPDGAIRLASPKSDEEYARVLYDALREGDRRNLPAIYVVPPSGGGIAIAIRDRLKRASS